MTDINHQSVGDRGSALAKADQQEGTVKQDGAVVQDGTADQESTVDQAAAVEQEETVDQAKDKVKGMADSAASTVQHEKSAT
ncbi:hypothetical protein JB92DRAFT_3124405 [Gautieria morchelliformis]|nr:hypothetical protein JB92DRAFT_3124405 [Gautieria morchelliformis]